MLVELVDKSLFLVRRENSPTELIEGVRGFGHTFPEAYTTWDTDIKQSVSHQRLLRYKFGDLRLLVRFEADGYLPTPHTETSKPAMSRAKTSEPLDVQNLTQSFKAAQTQIEENLTTTSAKDTLAVKQAGEAVSQNSIFDLKTRSIWKKNEDLLSKEIPRLWVAQISNFIAAYHERGIFKTENIVVRDVKRDVVEWENDQNFVLSQLVALLHILISKAHEQKDGRFEICRSGEGDLELRSQLADAGEALSLSVKKEWVRSSELLISSEKITPDSKDATNTL